MILPEHLVVSPLWGRRFVRRCYPSCGKLYGFERQILRTVVPSGLDRKEAELFSQLDPKQLPQHVAIIMDGNGRWAKRRHLPRIAGHRQGVEAVRYVIETAARIGLPAITLYAFSAENFLRRPHAEINFLMKLLRKYLKDELPLMQRNNI